MIRADSKSPSSIVSSSSRSSTRFRISSTSSSTSSSSKVSDRSPSVKVPWPLTPSRDVQIETWDSSNSLIEVRLVKSEFGAVARVIRPEVLHTAVNDIRISQ